VREKEKLKNDHERKIGKPYLIVLLNPNHSTLGIYSVWFSCPSPLADCSLYAPYFK